MLIKQIQKALILGLSITLIACDNPSSSNDNSNTTNKYNNSAIITLSTMESTNLRLNNNSHTTGILEAKDTHSLELGNYFNGANDYDTDEFTTEVTDCPSMCAPPISEYAYVAAGNYIEMYKIESSGNLVSIGSITPAGIPSTAKISSIAISPNHINLYATIQNGGNDDKIWALGLNAVNGRLTPLAKAFISTKKNMTSSVAVSRNSMFVYTSNSTQVCTYKILDNYGTLPDNPTFCISPLVNNKIYPYGQIKLSANNKYVFVSGGTSLNTLFTLKRESNGTLTEISQTDTKVNNNLSMAIPESGGFMYTALKGNYSVGQYSIDGATGKISPLSPQTVKSGTTEAEPHAVVLTPSRKYAYATNYHDNTIAIFNINADGTLKSSPKTITAKGNPDKIAMDKTGGFIYVSTKDKHILQYAIDRETGNLTPLANSTLNVWESGANIAVTDIEGLHTSLISPVYTHDVPLDTKYVIDLSNGYSESSVRLAGNIVACQIEESKYNPESMAEMNVSTTSFAGCPSGSSSVMVGDIFDLSPTQIGFTFIGLIATHQVMIFLNNIKDAFGNTYKDQEIVLDTTVAENTIISPVNGTKNVSTHSGIYAGFTENINPNSPYNKITITYHTEDGGIEMINLGGVTADGTTLGAPAPTGGMPVGEIDINVQAETSSGAVATASGSATIIEESAESKLIIYVAIGRDGLGYTGNLAQYDSSGRNDGIVGADAECNADYNKPPNRSGSTFKAMIANRERGDMWQIPSTIRRPQTPRYRAANWVLKINTPYYNAREAYIATTIANSVFPAEIPFANQIGPTALIGLGLNEIWTGIIVRNYKNSWSSDYSSGTCQHWHTSISTETNQYGMIISHKGMQGDSTLLNDLKAIDAKEVEGIYNSSALCGEHKGLYCAEQAQ